MGAFEDFVRAELPNRQVLLIGTGNPATANSGAGTVAAIGAYWLDKNDNYKRYVRFGLNNTDWELVPTWSTGGGGSGTVNLPQSAYWQATYSVVSANSANWNNVYSFVASESGNWDHSSAGYLTTISIPQSAVWQSTYSVVSTNSADWSDTYSVVSTNSADWSDTYSVVSTNSADWNTAYTTVTSQSSIWSAAFEGNNVTLPLSANWSTAYNTVTANSADWNTAYNTVTANSADWNTAYNTVTASSADWDTAYSAVTASSADWDTAYSAVTASSADWDTAYSAVTASSADWDTAYSAVTANSAVWNAGYTTLTANSADWDTAYNTVTANSGDWTATYLTVTANSANWDTAYSSVTANSADWDTAYNTVTSNSANWDATYLTVTANSANWDTAYSTVTSNSANWDATYTTVSANSANWDATYSTVCAYSADWGTSYTTLSTNSANWDATYTTVSANSANWDSTYSTVCAYSADWDLGATAYSLISANSAIWGSAQGDGSSGSGSVIAPLAYASMSTATSGEGTNLDWYYDSSTASYDVEFHYDQINTDYTVVTDAQNDDVNRAIVTNKTVSSFQVDIRSSFGSQITDSLGITVMVYGSNPLIGTGFDPNNTSSGSDSDLGSASWTTITANSASWLGGAGDGVGAAGAFITDITCGTNSTRTGGITTLIKDSNEVAVDGKTPVLTATVDTPTVRLWTQWEGNATEWTGCPLISTFPVSANARTNISSGHTRRFQGYYDLDLTSYRGSTATIPLEYSGLTKYVDVAVAGLGPEVVDFQVISTPQYGQDHYKDGDTVTFIVVFDTTDVSSITFGGAQTYATKTASNVPVTDNSITMNGVSATCVREVDTISNTKVNKPFSITAKNAFGTAGVEYISSATIELVSGPIITNIAVGSLPGSQTELKSNDQLDITMEFDTTNVDFISPSGPINASGGSSLNMSGVSATKTFVVSDTSTQTDAAGGVDTTFYLSAKKSGHHDQVGPQINSQVDFGTQLPINNRRPTFSGFAVTYPDNTSTGGYAQQALQVGDTATVALTVSQAGASPSISWTNNGLTQLTIADPTTLQGAGPNTYTQSKTVSCVGSTYNINLQNIKCEVTRIENDNSFPFTGVVQIADTAPTINVVTRDENNNVANGTNGRLRSGGNNSTNPQTYNVQITQSGTAQRLLQAPTLVAPVGTLGNAFSWTSNATTFNNTITIDDDDLKGDHTYSSLLAVNLAGKEVTTINSGSTYTCGGFVSRNITLAGYASGGYIDVLWSDYSKLDFDWSFPSNPAVNTRYPAGTYGDTVGGWSVHDQTTSAHNTNNTPSNSSKPKIVILDQTAANASSNVSTITIEETV